ncbi:MAG: hypothetical protein AAF514_07250, partial [Verrucomicrobiota bacterium]
NYVRHGGSPRAAQSILAAARARALLDGRFHVSREDIDAVAVPAMRHRLILSFEGEAEGIQADSIIGEVLKDVGKTSKPKETRDAVSAPMDQGRYQIR